MRMRWKVTVITAFFAASGVVWMYDRVLALSPPAPLQEQKKLGPTSTQVLMRDKLTQANRALEGLALEDFDKVAESAEKLRMISRASSWYVIDSEEYMRYSKNFQEEAVDLARHAKQKNLDAASLDYMRMTMTCVQCHQHLRAAKAAKKP